MRSPALWESHCTGKSALTGLGHASVIGLSPRCGHCWPRLKGISHSQPHLHPWGPPPLILSRLLTITTSQALGSCKLPCLPSWEAYGTLISLLPLQSRRHPAFWPGCLDSSSLNLAGPFLYFISQLASHQC